MLSPCLSQLQGTSKTPLIYPRSFLVGVPVWRICVSQPHWLVGRPFYPSVISIIFLREEYLCRAGRLGCYRFLSLQVEHSYENIPTWKWCKVKKPIINLYGEILEHSQHPPPKITFLRLFSCLWTHRANGCARSMEIKPRGCRDTVQSCSCLTLLSVIPG